MCHRLGLELESRFKLIWNFRGMESILFFFRQDLQDWRDFFRLRRGALSAEGRSILMILLILSNFLLKKFLFRSDWTLAASGRAYTKHHLFRQDLSTELEADFQQDFQDFF